MPDAKLQQQIAICKNQKPVCNDANRFL